ncbi:MAG: protein kinase, partial [Gemmatimonadota bacterium]
MPDADLDRVKVALAHRYRITDELPGGGMAVVWLAEDLRHKRQVAIKVLRPALAAAVGTARFLREIEVLASLEHPHILTLIDSGKVEGLPWYVMPFVEGQSLEDRIRREGALPVDEVVRIGREVAGALQYAHERRVIHRDVKPGNVLLSDGHAVVADFGIAGALDESAEGRITETGVSVGSPAYMSPEQASGERDLDERTDIYSLGCVLYEMLAGAPPFSGSLKAVATNKVMGSVRPLADLRPDASPALHALVARAMSVERDDRFSTAEELGAALAATLPEAGPERSGRRRTVVGAAAMAAVIVGAMFAIYRVQAANERELWIARQLTAIEQLAEDGSYAEALALAREVEEVRPADTTLARLWPRFSFTVPIRSDPPGARVSRRPMDDAHNAWEYLGETPLEAVRFPGVATALAYMEDNPVQLRFELDGYRDVEVLETAILGVEYRNVPPLDPVRLTPEDSLPEGMVRIPRFTASGHAFGDYFMDRYEVTNRAFAAFVAAGGYRKPDYWEEPFLKDGEELLFEDATGLFVDQTGRPGPSTWRLGTYPDGEGDYPVGGVSWYEAAAYARWAGGQLPTTTHWSRARRHYRENSYLIVPRSNLGGSGPRPVGLNRAMTTLGVYDMV